MGKARENIVHLENDKVLRSIQSLVNKLTELSIKERVKKVWKKQYKW